MAIDEEFSESANDESSIFQKSIILFIIGFFIIFAGIIILIIAAVLSNGSANFGAVIFIGPFPIVVGAGPEATWMVLFAVILAILSIIAFVILRREMGRVDV